MTRTTDTVATAEIEPMITLLTDAGASNSDVAEAIGYSPSMISDARRTGTVRTSIKYALMGLIAERKGDLAGFVQPQLPFVLNFLELTALLIALRRMQKADPEAAGPVLHLIRRVGAEVARQAVEGDE